MVSKALRLAVHRQRDRGEPARSRSRPPRSSSTSGTASGQGVAPVYEGFDINPDGSFNMWFGYMNRNYEEAVDIPVGADNTFEPGGDRGQPTHFTPRRHKDVFKVTVPKDFGDQTTRLEADGARPDRSRSSRRSSRSGRSIGCARRAAATARRSARTCRRSSRSTRRVQNERDGATLTVSRDRRRPAEAARRTGRPDGDVGEVSRPRRRAVLARPQAKLANGTGDDDRDVHRAGRLHPAGGRRRRLGRVGRQLRLSLLLDQHAGEDHGQGRSATPTASNRQSAISESAIDPTFAKDVAPIFQKKLPDVPSPGHVGADVARHLRRSPAVGAVDPAARRQPRHAAVASRQDRRHPPLQERSLAERRRDRDDRALGRRRRAAGQPGRHAGAADVPLGGRVVHRRAGSEGDDAERLRDVRQGPGLVDRSVRRRRRSPRTAGSSRWRSSRATRRSSITSSSTRSSRTRRKARRKPACSSTSTRSASTATSSARTPAAC